ncbi:ImmA/IrrE family metallo-endopeptidase [Zoogloea sp.]|uniref:ImmA/IrrE family metallo-endopeptidase n=1 Tax=Zoogloea sp. TaxID=49181 RepID=UPI0035B2AC15
MLHNLMSAQEVLEAHWDGDVPVRPIAIAQAMGIQVFKSIDLGCSGQISVLDGGEVELIFNDGEPLVRKRFTVAHEIGHFALGHLSESTRLFRDEVAAFSSKVRDPKEVQANRFAAQLLMPADALRLAIQQGGKTISQLAEMFRVSEVAMKFRLINLGMLRG